MGLLQRFLRLFESNDDVRYVTDSSCMKLVKPIHQVIATIRWDEIEEICAYKADKLTVDEVCIGFRTQSRWYEIGEFHPEFQAVVSVMHRHLNAFPNGWYEEVELPPFATNYRTLWQRQESADENEGDSN